MPIKTPPLTDVRCRSARATPGRSRKLFDGGGLFLEVKENGSKLWRLKYRHLGKEKLLSFGAYPAVSLAAARDHREEAKRQMARGVDPSLQRQADKRARNDAAANTLESVAREWHAKNKKKWVDSYSDKILLRLDKDVFPAVGSRPIAELEAQDLVPVLRQMESRGVIESAHRVRRHLSEIFRYAIALGLAKHDIAHDLRSVVGPAESKNYASITDPVELGKLLRAIDAYEGEPSTRTAMALAPILFCRPGELRGMKWEELDLEQAEWRLPPPRQKVRKKAKQSNKTPPIIFPLPRQAVLLLEAIKPITGRSEFVFPSTRSRDRSMSDGTVNAALRRMGYTKDQITGHGFRHTASTLLNEQRKWSSDAIEVQLSHKDGTIRGIYNGAKYMDERKEMMQSWADFLDKLRKDAT